MIPLQAHAIGGSPSKPPLANFESLPAFPPPISMPTGAPAPVHYAPAPVHYVVGQALLDITFTDDPALYPAAPSRQQLQPLGPLSPVQDSYQSLVDALSELRLGSIAASADLTLESVNTASTCQQHSQKQQQLQVSPAFAHQQCPVIGMVSIPSPAAALPVQQPVQAVPAGRPPSADAEPSSPPSQQSPRCTSDQPSAATAAAGAAMPTGSASQSHMPEAGADLTASLSKDGGAVVLQNPDGTTALVLLTSDATRRTQAQQAGLRQQYGCCVDISTYEVWAPVPLVILIFLDQHAALDKQEHVWSSHSHVIMQGLVPS